MSHVVLWGFFKKDFKRGSGRRELVEELDQIYLLTGDEGGARIYLF